MRAGFIAAEHDVVPAGRTDPERTYVIASTERSGSTLLGDAFSATGVLGAPHEFLQSSALGEVGHRFGSPRPTVRAHAARTLRRLRRVPDWRATLRMRPNSMPAYVEALQQHRTTPNGVFGLKAHWGQVASLREFEIDPFELFAWRRAVLITREDRVRQAVSLHRARRTGRWRAEHAQEPMGPEEYDADEIAWAISLIEASEAGWREELDREASAGVAVLEVTYEQLVEDPVSTLARCFDFLGVPGTPIPEITTVRQADDVNEQWVQRYLEERAVGR